MTPAHLDMDKCMTIHLDYELPEYPAFEEGYRRAPRRESHLTEADKILAIKNALRYIHPDHHEQMAKEFAQELEEHGRIYGYRFRGMERKGMWDFVTEFEGVWWKAQSLRRIDSSNMSSNLKLTDRCPWALCGRLLQRRHPRGAVLPQRQRRALRHVLQPRLAASKTPLGGVSRPRELKRSAVLVFQAIQAAFVVFFGVAGICTPADTSFLTDHGNRVLIGESLNCNCSHVDPPCLICFVAIKYKCERRDRRSSYNSYHRSKIQ